MRATFASVKQARAGAALGLALLLAGCATDAPRRIAAPIFAEQDCRTAVTAGAKALAVLSREQIAAAQAGRQPDYRPAQGDLARAVAALEPARQSATRPGYEQAAVHLAAALAAVERISAAQARGDRDQAAIGSEMLDQATKALLLILDEQKTAGAGRR